jgi:hypothetical protein
MMKSVVFLAGSRHACLQRRLFGLSLDSLLVLCSLTDLSFSVEIEADGRTGLQIDLSEDTLIVNLMPVPFLGTTHQSLFEQSEHEAAHWALMELLRPRCLNVPDPHSGRVTDIVLSSVRSQSGWAVDGTLVFSNNATINEPAVNGRFGHFDQNGNISTSVCDDLLRCSDEEITRVLRRL